MTTTRHRSLWLRKLVAISLLTPVTPVVAHTVDEVTSSSFFHNITHTVEFLSFFVMAMLVLYGSWKIISKSLSRRPKKI